MGERLVLLYAGRRLYRALRRRRIARADARKMVERYRELVRTHLTAQDACPGNAFYSHQLNMFTGLAVYELLTAAGFQKADAILVYEEMVGPMRVFASMLHRGADLTPRGFEIVRDSVKRDMTDETTRHFTWEIVQDDADAFEYKITRCPYVDTFAKAGCPEFCIAFCEHDRAAYDSLRCHVKFTRTGRTLAEGGSCCHDRFERVKR